MAIGWNGISSIIKTRGNPYTHAILRGSDHGTNYHKEFISTFSQILIDHNISPNIMIDCSHGNSNKSYKEQIKVVDYLIQLINSGNNDIMGLMIESNIKAGNQKLSNNLEYGVSITDECIDWSTTVLLLKKLKYAVQNNNGKKYNLLYYYHIRTFLQISF